jgi:uncharacterized protein YfaT (DUF1175 family)
MQRGAERLLFYNQGDAQHLMVWMGSFIAYHSGTVAVNDNGHWRQGCATCSAGRHPLASSQHNPNFVGVYRLAF